MRTPGAPSLRGRGRAGRHLDGLTSDWRRLAADDPLWAVCVAPGRQSGGWDAEDLYALGRREVEDSLARAAALGLEVGRGEALDFGCGVGRLSLALADRVEHVVGVDIAPEMVAHARRRAGDRTDVEFVVNDRPDLSLFEDGRFRLVFTSLVLQHLPASLAASYLCEMGRVLAPGGVLVAHAPDRPTWSLRGQAFRWLPGPVTRQVQRRLLGYPAPMRMTMLPGARVRATLAGAGVQVVASDPERRYGGYWHELRHYGVRLPASPAGQAPGRNAGS